MSYVSGGARGADTAWASSAILKGREVEIMSFPGHPRTDVDGAIVNELSNEQLLEANPHLEQAGKCLQRTPTSSWSRKYLQRDWHIIKDADAVFAIGNLMSNSPGIRVAGGTGWTCQMYFNRGQPASVNMWLFDQREKQWFKCSPVGDWEESVPPNPSSNEFTRVALIGSRELTIDGLNAIREVKL